MESHFPVHGTVIAETPYVVSYFFNRDSLRRPLLIVGGEVTRPETPYVVSYWVAGDFLTSAPCSITGTPYVVPY